ncbi:MAG: hypothetical protein WCG42_08890 [Parachlamydiaceae bacterium]
MKKASSLLFLFISLLTLPLWAVPGQVTIIPHVEADSDDEITQAGWERAGALAAYIDLTPQLISFGAPIAIFAGRPSTLNPTEICMQSVAPTAELLKQSIHAGYAAGSQEQTLANFVLTSPLYDGKNVLICWQPENITSLATFLGVSSPPIFESNVSNVTWVITYSPTTTLTIYPQLLMYDDAF